MKEGLRLKIGKHWCALAPDTSISIEMTSPLWNDSGSFSYTFKVPYAENRHIFNAAEMPESDVNLKSFRQRFELYVDGIGLLFGDAVCSSDEIDEEEDSVDIELRSGNATFEDAIEGKTLRDLDFGTDALMGSYTKEERVYTPEYIDYESGAAGIKRLYPLKEDPGGKVVQIINKTEVYPIRPYINIPVLVAGVNQEGVKKTLFLSEGRSFTSPCFYMLFVLKKVLSFTNIAITKNDLNNVEDLKRIVFINMKCEYKADYISENTEGKIKVAVIGSADLEFAYKGVKHTGSTFFTSDNLPDISMSEFIESLKNAFGLRVISSNNETASVIMLKNVFRNTKTNSIKAREIYSIKKRNIAFNGVKMSFSSDEGDEYKYSDYKNARLYRNYEQILLEWSNIKDAENGEQKLSEDIILKIAADTGNYVRTKADKDEYDGPQLFEVAQFLPYEVKGSTTDEEVEELSIGFNPVITTTTANASYLLDRLKIPSRTFFANVEILNHPSNWDFLDYYIYENNVIKYTLNPQHIKNLIEYDCGFMLGIVRSSPEGALSTGYTIVRENADNFGNAEWVKTMSTTEITNDSVDMSGALYDYNGTDPGIGIPMDELISLKIWNNKQNFDPENLISKDESGNVITGADAFNNNPTGPLPNRGLYPQFMAEYIHFLKHRKPLTIEMEVEVAELPNIKWDEYYNLSGFRFLLDKITFNVSNDGIGVVTMDVYCI